MSNDADHRRAVCRALTDAVRSGSLADRIEPKSFFMMLHTNFPVLSKSGRFQLSPVWDALRTKCDEDPLIGLFLRLAQVLEAQGLEPMLPPAVASLPARDRAARLAAEPRVAGGWEGEPLALPEDALRPVIAESSDADVFLALGTGDLQPVVAPETRRALIEALIKAIKASPIGSRVRSAQIAYLVDSNFESLCNGRRFDFGPVLDALRQVEGYVDEDVHVTIALLRDSLAGMHITLDAPEVGLDRAKEMNIVDEHRTQERRKLRRQSSNRDLPSQDPVPPPPPAEEAKRRQVEAHQKSSDRLASMGLAKSSGKRQPWIRYTILGAVLAILGGVFWTGRPSRPLDLESYDAVFPFKSVELRQGTFAGVVDSRRWSALDPAARTGKLDALEKLLRTKGLVNTAQVRDEGGQLVITSRGGGKLAAAAFFLAGNAAGEQGTPPLDTTNGSGPPP